MTPEDEAEIVAHMRAARARRRGYADFFGWSSDRTLEEWGAVTALHESLVRDGKLFFQAIKRRERGRDPPDCEAIDAGGKRIAIEVSELVSEKAIEAFRIGDSSAWAEWPRAEFLVSLNERLARKSSRKASLKDGPYEGGYVIVIFTDEPMLNLTTVRSYLAGQVFGNLGAVSRAFLLLSYDPAISGYPYFELPLSDGDR